MNLHFLCDVLYTVGSLSTAFQNNQVNLLSIEGLVKEKLAALERLQIKEATLSRRLHDDVSR